MCNITVYHTVEQDLTFVQGVDSWIGIPTTGSGDLDVQYALKVKGVRGEKILWGKVR